MQIARKISYALEDLRFVRILSSPGQVRNHFEGHLRCRNAKPAPVLQCIDSQLHSGKTDNMRLNPVPHSVALAGLRAIKTMCLRPEDGKLTDLQSKFIDGVQKNILLTDIDLNSLATLKQFFPLRGIPLPDVTARYHKLDDSPEGTLGRAFIHYQNKNNFPYPGEVGAGPEIIVVHDCAVPPEYSDGPCRPPPQAM